jgi:hypothetical protein
VKVQRTCESARLQVHNVESDGMSRRTCLTRVLTVLKLSKSMKHEENKISPIRSMAREKLKASVDFDTSTNREIFDEKKMLSK